MTKRKSTTPPSTAPDLALAAYYNALVDLNIDVPVYFWRIVNDQVQLFLYGHSSPVRWPIPAALLARLQNPPQEA